MFLRKALGFKRNDQLILGIILFLVVICISILRTSDVQANGCGLEKGVLRAYLTGPYETWFFTWDTNGVTKQKIQYTWENFDNRLNIAKSTGDKRSDMLPQNLVGPTQRFDVPFAISHNKHMLISALYPNRFPIMGPQRIAIIDLSNTKILHVIEGGHVLSVEWSPNDEYIAMLWAQDVTDKKWKTPIDWFAKLLGHPISYYKINITIYTTNGKTICEKTIFERFQGDRGYIEWAG
jgi:hypothetical protein